MWFQILLLGLIVEGTTGLDQDAITLARDLFLYKNVKFVSFLSCQSQKGKRIVCFVVTSKDEGNDKNDNIKLVKHLSGADMRVSVEDARRGRTDDGTAALLRHSDAPVGVLMDGACDTKLALMELCSKSALFDGVHVWLLLNAENMDKDSGTKLMEDVENSFRHLNLSVDADITVASQVGNHYKLVDVFNFGKIQGNSLEQTTLGTWHRDPGLNISLKGFKYYNRWDFHNLTLRAVSVILDRPKVFHPSMLEDIRYTPGVSAMTKIVAQLLNILKEQHNFRFNYTIVDRWVGAPERNSTLGVTNLLYWGEQDISLTCMRIFSSWLEWVEPFMPPATQLQTKCYYLIPDKGVGDYENRFLTPLSGGVWLSAGLSALLCALVLFCSAAMEHHPQPATYAICSVFAAICQQGRRLTLLVVGVTSMLLYNYYTSSVVSWLLSAPPPTIDSLDGLIRSDLELIFEDIGYTRQWLDSPHFYYYSGFVNPKEDVLREVKVTNPKSKRTVGLFQSVEDGIELIRTGPYAYHSEPYTAAQAIGRRLSERELCELGALQVMQPAHVYIMGQKRSPYKQFFTWSLMRLLERGLTQASRRRVDGAVPACSGQTPRALALGQAAPAFALLIQIYCLATVILLVEMLWHRFLKSFGNANIPCLIPNDDVYQTRFCTAGNRLLN